MTASMAPGMQPIDTPREWQPKHIQLMTASMVVHVSISSDTRE
jgi:hypothetical protein